MEAIEKDARFAHTARDPRFKPNYKQKKVKIDSRFKSMLQDKEFNVKFLDKRGRPVNSSTKEDLRRLYQYESDEETDLSEAVQDTDDENDDSEQAGVDDKVEKSDEADDDDDEADDDDDEADDVAAEDEAADGVASDGEDDGESSDEYPDLLEDGPDYARGVGVVDSSDDDEEEEEEGGEGEWGDVSGLLDHNWNEPDHDAPQTEDVTCRMALCNMDWDRVKAKDLYLLFNSFAPQGGAVRSVTIYPSEFGREKLAKESSLGPWLASEDDRQDNRTDAIDPARLRQYQLDRLKYYYAILVCDSTDTAAKIYDECDSMEYEKSSCRIDLRYVPDDMTFDETAKDSCSGISETDLKHFQPTTFTTTAFCHANVQITWDEPNLERVHKISKLMQKHAAKKTADKTDKDNTEQEDSESEFMKVSEFLASDSDETSEEESVSKKKEMERRKKEYKKLVRGLGDGKPKKKKKKSVPAFVGSDSEEEGFFNTVDDTQDRDVTQTLNKDEDNVTKKKKKKLKEKNTNKKKTEKDSDIDGNKEKKKKKKDKDKETEKEKPKKGKESDKDRKKTKKMEQMSDSEGEGGKEGEMQYTWQLGANHQKLKAAGKALTPWEEFQQKKKDKKKQKKEERRQKRLQEKGIDGGEDLGFDDDFFKDEPSQDQGKKLKLKKKKKKAQEVETETEEDKKERAALALLMKGDDDNKKHFSLVDIMEEERKSKTKKGKKRKQTEPVSTDTFEMKLDSSRFSGLFTDPNMHIDPTAPEFKKTKGMVTLMDEVSKKRKTLHNAS